MLWLLLLLLLLLRRAKAGWFVFADREGTGDAGSSISLLLADWGRGTIAGDTARRCRRIDQVPLKVLLVAKGGGALLALGTLLLLLLQLPLAFSVARFHRVF